MRRAGAVVPAICGAAGILQGLTWAWLAPGVPYKVLADGRYGALPTTSGNHFVSLALFCWLGIIVGVVVAVVAWQRRPVRGWPTMLVLIGGSAAGALIAWWVGRVFAPGTDPATVGASAADSIVTAPPSFGTWLALLAQPAVAALAYLFLVAWDGRPDLGVPTSPPVLPAAETPRTDP